MAKAPISSLTGVPPSRRIVQATGATGFVVALCNDGTVFTCGSDMVWRQLPEIPQGEQK